jgi:hypothetical protein
MCALPLNDPPIGDIVAILPESGPVGSDELTGPRIFSLRLSLIPRWEKNG